LKYVSPDAEQRLCPFCRLVVYIDDAQQAVHHEAPMCLPFARKMREFGATESITIVPFPPAKA